MPRWMGHPLGFQLAGKNARWFLIPRIRNRSGANLKSSRRKPTVLRLAATLVSEQGLTDSELLLALLIDSAGKVRSVEPAENTKSEDPELLKAATVWKFVSAF